MVKVRDFLLVVRPPLPLRVTHTAVAVSYRCMIVIRKLGLGLSESVFLLRTCKDTLKLHENVDPVE